MQNVHTIGSNSHFSWNLTTFALEGKKKEKKKKALTASWMILKWSCGQTEKVSLRGLIAAPSLSLARCQDLSPSPNDSPNSVTAHCSLLGNDSGGSRPPGPSFNLSFFPAQQTKTPLEQKEFGQRRTSALTNCIEALFHLAAALRGRCCFPGVQTSGLSAKLAV